MQQNLDPVNRRLSIKYNFKKKFKNLLLNIRIIDERSFITYKTLITVGTIEVFHASMKMN